MGQGNILSLQHPYVPHHFRFRTVLVENRLRQEVGCLAQDRQREGRRLRRFRVEQRHEFGQVGFDGVVVLTVREEHYVEAAISVGTTHDLMLAWESLSDLIEIADILGRRSIFPGGHQDCVIVRGQVQEVSFQV
mgnify:CR=1 FL=1